MKGPELERKTDWKLSYENALLIDDTGGSKVRDAVKASGNKFRNVIKSNVYSLPCDPKNGRAVSMVFTDPNGEMYRDCAVFLAAHGYRIKVLNLIDMQCSDCYNPFRYIAADSDSVMDMVYSLVMNVNGGRTPKSQYGMHSAMTLLSSICHYVYYEYPFAEQNFRTVSRILDKCKLYEDDRSEYGKMIDMLRNKKYPDMDEHPAVIWYEKLNGVSADKEAMALFVSIAQEAIQPFVSKGITMITDVDTIELDTIGDRPTAVFLVIPADHDEYNSVISMVYTQMFESLYYRAQNVYHGSLTHHITFWMDEFVNAGKIPSFERKIAALRNMSAVIAVQSPSQLETMYEKRSQDIIDNCSQIVHIGSHGTGADATVDWLRFGVSAGEARCQAFQVINSLADDECYVIAKGRDPFIGKIYSAECRTACRYHEGLQNAVKVDEERRIQRDKAAEEKRLYDEIAVERRK